MKTLFLLIATVFLANTTLAADASGGGSPFIHSSAVLKTIFESPLVWQKIFGGIEKITLVQQNQKTATYQVSTIEMIESKDDQGVTTGWSKVACKAVVTVTNVSSDVFVPKLEVTKVDLSRCPSANK
ncbi:hypothetical protein [Bdellovibrio sp. HCB337]|uniref:hypothetical protein n=1 Tax=Bdellovibrio sp. HCB337 TaxID=3394358 RepID=UPI0039A6F0B6